MIWNSIDEDLSFSLSSFKSNLKEHLSNKYQRILLMTSNKYGYFGAVISFKIIHFCVCFTLVSYRLETVIYM